MGLTPLMIATKQEHLDTVNSLAQFKLQDINRLHCLHSLQNLIVVLCISFFLKETGVSAAILAASNGMIDICKELLDHGAYPEVEAIVCFFPMSHYYVMIVFLGNEDYRLCSKVVEDKI